MPTPMPTHVTKKELEFRINEDPTCIQKITVLVGDRVNVAISAFATTYYWCSLKHSNQPRGNHELSELKRKAIDAKGTFVYYEKDGASAVKHYYEKGELVRSKTYGQVASSADAVKVDLGMPVTTTTTAVTSTTVYKHWEFAGLKLPVRDLSTVPEFLHAWIPEADNGYVHQKEETRRVMSCILRQKGVFAKGHTGVGKTELFRSLAFNSGNPFIILPCSADMETSNLLGYNTVDSDGSVVFVEGLLTTAVRYGAWVYFDEFNAMASDITSNLNPLLDGSRCLVLTESKGARVPMHPEFRFLASGNPATHAGYTGIKTQNLALVNRLKTVLIDYLGEKQETNILHYKFQSIPLAYVEQLVKIANGVRKLFKQGDISAVLTTRDLIDVCEDAIVLLQAHANWDVALDDALASWVGGVEYQTDAKTIYGICSKEMVGKLTMMEKVVGRIVG